MTEILKKLDKLSDGHTEIIKEQATQTESLKYVGQKVGTLEIKVDSSIKQNEDLKKRMVELDNKMLRFDSWKNGQIIKDNVFNEFKSDVIKRLPPLEKDLNERLDQFLSKKKWWQGIGLDMLKTLLKGLFYSLILFAMLAFTSKEFWGIFAKFL